MERREAMDGSATIAINRGMGEEQQGLRSIWRNGKDAKDCPSVPLKVKTFFNHELDRIKGKKMERERSKMRAYGAYGAYEAYGGYGYSSYQQDETEE